MLPKTTKTEINAGFSIFFSVWTMTFLYGHVMRNFGFEEAHWFSSICILACFGCLISAIFIKQPFMIAPGLSIGWFFSHLLTNNTNAKTVFLALTISGILIIGLGRLRLIRETKQFLPDGLQEAINIGIGFLFIRIALEQQFNHFQLQDFYHFKPYLFIFTVASLFIFKLLKIKSGLLITVIATIALAYMTKLTHWQGLFATPTGIINFFSLSHQPIEALSLSKHILEITLFSLFDTAIGVFCLQQLQVAMHHPTKPALSPAYACVGLNNLLSGFFLCGPNTAYIESTIGIQLGAKRSLSILVVAICFAIFLFCYPINHMIPKELFRGILFFIGCSLITPLYKVRYRSLTGNLLSLSLIGIMIIRKSIIDGLIIGILAIFIYDLINKNKTQALIIWSAIFSMIILLLRFF
jgi:AGZA family xanthine/uracil permease-like MFS transporter